MANPFADTESVQANRDLFTSYFTKDHYLLESVLECLKEKKLVPTTGNDGGFKSEAEKASFLMKTIETLVEADKTNSLVILDVFKQHKQLQDILTDIKVKSKQADLRDREEKSSSSSLSTASSHQSVPHVTTSTSTAGSSSGTGYDDDLFLTVPPKDYQCPICYLVLREPLLYSCCGAHVCQECANRSDKDRCPSCNQATFTSILNKGLRGKILSLRVKCRNSPCTWVGDLLDLDDHVSKTCLHAKIPCRLNCGQLVTRSNSDDHEDLWCRNRPMNMQVVGMQRLLLAEIIGAKGNTSDNARVLLRQLQAVFDSNHSVVNDTNSTRSQLRKNAENMIAELKQSIFQSFETHSSNVNNLKPPYGSLMADVSRQVETVVQETKSNHRDGFRETETTVAGITEESSQLRERLKLAEAQVARLEKVSKNLLQKFRNDTNAKMMRMKDMEIDQLRAEVQKLKSNKDTTDNSTPDQVIPEPELSVPHEDKRNQGMTEDVTSQEEEHHETPQEVSSHEEGERKDEATPTETDEGEEDQLKSKEGSCSSVDVFERSTGRDVSIQFDYWVPMKDLLYGATVVDETVFNVHGDQEQIFNWSECGFSLRIPTGSLDRIETCPVAVKALISGRFKFPKGFQLLSALYAISPGRKFKEKIEMSIQHCFLIEREDQLKKLRFIKASATSNPNNPYVFEYVDGGIFTIGEQYCHLQQKEFSIYGAGVETGQEGSNPSSRGERGQQQDGDESSTSGTHDDDDRNPDENVPTVDQQNSTDSSSTHHDESEYSNRGLEEGGALVPGICNPLSTKGNFIPVKYRAHFYYEETRRNSWNLELAAVQELKAHIKYVNDHLSSRRKLESFQFYFLDQADPAIRFEFTDEQKNNLPNGWFVKPLTIPCFIPKEEVDTLSIQEQRLQSNEEEIVIPDIPTRKVCVFAESFCTISHMDYKMGIEGIKDTKTFCIVRQLDQTNGGVIQSPSNTTGQNNGTVERTDSENIADMKKFKSLLIDQINHRFADLKSLFSGTLGTFANRLFQNGMISPDINSNPNFDTLMGEITSSLQFKKKTQGVIEHCRKFLRIMSEIGVPQKDAASSIAEDMEEATLKEFNVTIKFCEQ